MPTLFELHLTTTELDEAQLTKFVAFCDTIAAKPILIELPEGQQRQQPMISKVVRCAVPDEIHGIINALQTSFTEAGFPVKRVKVEVPTDHRTEAEKAFPDFLGGYYEWHGSVKVVNEEKLLNLCRMSGAHLSANALKNKKGVRLVTVRGTANERGFRYLVRELTANLANSNYPLLKEEAEYCVFDSDKSPDKGWINTLPITNFRRANQFAFDAFLRRAAIVNGPFMLKGSLVTRQYLNDREEREAQDLDFVYLGVADKKEAVETTFTKWVTAVTETEMDDRVDFSSFSENPFWRGIDYAMDDDFPTTNTDLYCQIDKQDHIIDLDISWNLMTIFPATDYPPVPLSYQPAQGSSFLYPYTAPLSLQISWKLHQLVVRPRRKDMEDLIMLFEQSQLDAPTISLAIQAFRTECRRDNLSGNRLRSFFYARAAIDPTIGNLLNESTSYPSRNWSSPEALLEAFAIAARDAGMTDAFSPTARQNGPVKKSVSKRNPVQSHQRANEVSPVKESWWQRLRRRLNI
jgi:hypothetical protein